ncbi:MAG: hypothetical protein [Olavius algarvensis spirochete endosymbiont]|nr:MAG: hypothetical protein [Olavius algarvensis spirochete endosymbiont]
MRTPLHAQGENIDIATTAGTLKEFEQGTRDLISRFVNKITSQNMLC